MACSKHHRGTIMEHYAGIDVSLEQSSVCVVDATGRIVREAKVASEPEALARWFAELALPLARIGLGSGPLSPSGDYRRPLLCRRIERAALDGSMRACGRRGSLSSCWRPGMCATRSRRCRSRPTGLRGHLRALDPLAWTGSCALRTMDARGIAQLMRLGWFRPVHCRSLPAQETRALLTARKLLQAKLHDVEMSLRGILRGFGLKVGATTAEPSKRASASWWPSIRR